MRSASAARAPYRLPGAPGAHASPLTYEQLARLLATAQKRLSRREGAMFLLFATHYFDMLALLTQIGAFKG